MLFNSWKFIGFFLVIYAVIGLFRRSRTRVIYQNFFLLAASYTFYAGWHTWYLLLIIGSTLVDYFVGLQLGKTADPVKRKILLWISIGVNISVLCFFKYYDFGVENLVLMLGAIGLEPDIRVLNLVLPVGISFYTFQTLSYTIDIYRREMEPTKDLVSFALFVAFFPQLVAGPIERAKKLLPQLQQPRIVTWDDLRYGGLYTVMGFFYKVVIADSVVALGANAFKYTDTVSGLANISGILAFSLRAYGDFAGYSFIAIGIARLMGIRLSQNFNTPYLSTSITELWQRWHMTLFSWFKDYIYIPLGGNRKGKVRTYFNILVVFYISGVWHGAAWTYILFGVYHGVLVMIERVFREKKEDMDIRPVWWIQGLKRIRFYGLWLIGIAMFFADSMEQFYQVLYHSFANAFYQPGDMEVYLMPVLIWHLILFSYHAWQRKQGSQAALLGQPVVVQLAAYVFMISTILAVGFRVQPYIYFQF